MREVGRGVGRGIAAIRLAAALWVALYALSYEPTPGHPLPGYVTPASITLALLLGATAIGQLMTRMRRSQDPRLLGLVVDTAVVLGLSWLYVFDPSNHMYVLLIPVQAEATLLLGPRWGVGAWALTTGAFAVERTVAGTAHAPGFLFFSAAGLLGVASVGALSRNLTAQNRLFNALLEHSPEAILIVDESGAIETANARTVRLFGYERRELIGMPVEMLVPERLGEAHTRHRAKWTSAPVARPLNSGHVLLGLRKDGSEFRADILLSPASSGGRLRTLVMVRDITERHEMQEALDRTLVALRESEGRYRETVERLNEVVFALDITSSDPMPQPVLVAGAVGALTGRTSEEFLNDPQLWWSLIHPDDRDAVEASAARMFDTKEPVTREYRLKNQRSGEYRWVQDYSVPQIESESVVRVSGVARDITERKLAEEAVRESEARYRSLFENMLEGFAYCRMIFEGGEPRDFVYLDVNRKFDELTGLRDVVGKRVTEVIPGIRESNPELFEIYGRVALTGTPEWFETYLDNMGWLSISVYSPEREHFVAVFENITERRRAEDALRDSESRFRFLVDNSPDLIFRLRFEQEPRFEYMSPSCTAMTGYTPSEFYADPQLAISLIAPDDRQQMAELFTSPENIPDSLSLRLIRKDGSLAWWDVKLVSFRDEEGNVAIVQGICRNITELKRAEDDLRQSLDDLRRTDEKRRHLLSRLVAAQEEERARIAADIHDDSIQVMSAVGMRLGALLGSPSEKERVQAIRKLEETVSASISRLRYLIFELRPRVLDEDGLSAALRVHLDLMREQTGIDVSLVDHLATQPETADRVILYRIAQEALANVRKHSRASQAVVTLGPQDGGVLVRIEDDGVGFDQASRGSSDALHLGLAAMRERAESAGGWIQIESSPGAGTRLDFYVPSDGTSGPRRPA